MFSIRIIRASTVVSSLLLTLISFHTSIFIFGPSFFSLSWPLVSRHTLACGIEFCIECEDNHCLGCLLGSELHNGECVAGELVIVTLGIGEGKRSNINAHHILVCLALPVNDGMGDHVCS